jgi:hypothetical protein
LGETVQVRALLPKVRSGPWAGQAYRGAVRRRTCRPHTLSRVAGAFAIGWSGACIPVLVLGIGTLWYAWTGTVVSLLIVALLVVYKVIA